MGLSCFEVIKTGCSSRVLDNVGIKSGTPSRFFEMVIRTAYPFLLYNIEKMTLLNKNIFFVEYFIMVAN